MIAALSELLSIGQDALWSGFVVFARVGAAMALLPAFGEQTVPARVRLILALMFTLVVLPAMAERIPPPVPGLGFAPILLTETLAGLFFGMALRLFVLALQIAGTIAAQSNLAQPDLRWQRRDRSSAGNGSCPALGRAALATILGLHVRLGRISVDQLRSGPARGDPARRPSGRRAGLGEIGRSFAPRLYPCGAFRHRLAGL